MKIIFKTYLVCVILLSCFSISPQLALANGNQSQSQHTQSEVKKTTLEEKKEVQSKKKSEEKVEVKKDNSNQLSNNEQKINTESQPRAPNNTASQSKDWEDQFITNTELQDEKGNAKTTFGIHDNMQAVWDYKIPSGYGKAGDKITVDIPSVFNLSKDVSFDIKDSGGTVIGHAFANHKSGKVIVTLTNAVKEDHNEITGTFKLWVRWNTSKVKEGTSVPVYWENVGTTNVDIVSGKGPDSNEVLAKWGWYDTENPDIIHWRVRINYAQEVINNAKYKDIIGANQELVSGSITVYKIKYNSNNNFDIIYTYPSTSTIEDHTAGFTTNLGNIKDTVIIDYQTKITDNGASVKYSNKGDLTGDNIENHTLNVYSPNNGGDGNANMTINVKGKKTWNDNNNKYGNRPDNITIVLLANDKKVQSKKVTAKDNWQYSFKNLPEYDNGKRINYRITEKKVENYKSKIDGYNITNSYLPEKINVDVTKVWEDKDNKEGIRPNSIEVQLYANGKEKGERVVLTPETNWNYVWKDLVVKQDGKDISYTVKEIGVIKGYTSKVNNNNKTHIIITNTHEPVIPKNPPENPVIPKNPPENPVIPKNPPENPVVPKSPPENSVVPKEDEKISDIKKIKSGKLLPHTGDRPEEWMIISGIVILLIMFVYKIKKRYDNN